jgi:hypothetical protein
MAHVVIEHPAAQANSNPIATKSESGMRRRWQKDRPGQRQDDHFLAPTVALLGRL